ncbi:hypothetical protein ACFQ9Z_23625 [Streptomyces sp. NPDC056580]|uniref:hypothetical protein n=1 Tax=Streptomyces sp. NPDC056580 TaxID=3345872 RepID=UPI003674C0D7
MSHTGGADGPVRCAALAFALPPASVATGTGVLALGVLAYGARRWWTRRDHA